MKQSVRQQIARFFSTGFTVLTILVATLLIIQCTAIYTEGTSAANVAENGVRIHDIYSPQIVAARFSSIAWAAVLWLAMGIGAVIFRPKERQDCNPRVAPEKRTQATAKCRDGRRAIICRIVLYAVAVAFVVLGVVNGGMEDVFNKAIRICTECIGLG